MSAIASGCFAGCASMCAIGCCSSVGSVCNSCFGNDKPSTDAPSVRSGRKRSVFLLTLSVVVSLVFQYGLAPALRSDGGPLANVPLTGSYVSGAWNDGCESNYETKTAIDRCRGNAAAYRVAFVTVAFFLLAGLSARCQPTSNREVWPAKMFLWSCGVVATVFIPSDPLFSDVFLNVGRVGGALFLVAQQLILLDLSYNLNEGLVARADDAESIETGSGKKWLATILVACAALFLGSVVAIGLLFRHYGGCASNEAFLSVTLVASVLVTVVQLYGEEASLLTSAFVSAYATYLAFVAVNKNPDAACNPTLGTENDENDDVPGIVLGLAFTVVSLAWAGWSNTASKRLLDDDDDDDNTDDNYAPPAPRVQGVVVANDPERQSDNGNGSNYGSTSGNADNNDNNNNDNAAASGAGWKINVLLALVACWVAMTLTGWGSVKEGKENEEATGGGLANPQVHTVSMWMVIASQWTVLALYLWSLVAPKLFPDRDFS